MPSASRLPSTHLPHHCSLDGLQALPHLQTPSRHKTAHRHWAFSAAPPASGGGHTRGPSCPASALPLLCRALCLPTSISRCCRHISTYYSCDHSRALAGWQTGGRAWGGMGRTAGGGSIHPFSRGCRHYHYTRYIHYQYIRRLHLPSVRYACRAAGAYWRARHYHCGKRHAVLLQQRRGSRRLADGRGAISPVPHLSSAPHSPLYLARAVRAALPVAPIALSLLPPPLASPWFFYQYERISSCSRA